MHGSRSKIPSKKSRQAALRGRVNSGINGLMYVYDFYPVAACTSPILFKAEVPAV
jgi:hypothetical protein